MSNSKSAKDLAFEKERAKYRKQINELERQVRKAKVEKLETEEKLREAERNCEELQDWIERLLNYTEMSEEDMKKIIEKEKQAADAMEHLNRFLGIGRRLGGTYFGSF